MCLLQLRLGTKPVAMVVLNGITVVTLPEPVTFDNAQLFVSPKDPTPREGYGEILSYVEPGGRGPSTPLVERPVPSRFHREDPL